MASKRSVDIVNEEEDEEEENCAHQEVALSEMRQDVVSLVGLQHPIMYDTNNICELASSSKLTATFSVSVLRDICLSLDIDVSGISVRRTKPYVDKLQDLQNWQVVLDPGSRSTTVKKIQRRLSSLKAMPWSVEKKKEIEKAVGSMDYTSSDESDWSEDENVKILKPFHGQEIVDYLQ
ncbi:hypothetical protein P5673_015295 [Acropora cervicornis]|uniref:Uncharacterized protein n=1 Tax=Acropora cervicornis TaxID=6130 RepID=A0AAD9QJ85_ACRCE|nr:hypothetical protein P5673_015295 [Acropora cervicornis]